MVKNKKSANKSSDEFETTDTGEDKTKSVIFDSLLSPLLCRKLNFTTQKNGNFKDHIPKQILSHKKTKNALNFKIDWENSATEFPLPTKVTLKSIRKHCPDLLIDYLLTKL